MASNYCKRNQSWKNCELDIQCQSNVFDNSIMTNEEYAKLGRNGAIYFQLKS